MGTEWQWAWLATGGQDCEPLEQNGMDVSHVGDAGGEEKRGRGYRVA